MCCSESKYLLVFRTTVISDASQQASPWKRHRCNVYFTEQLQDVKYVICVSPAEPRWENCTSFSVFLSVCLEKAGAVFSTWKREMSNKKLRKLLQSILLLHRARCDCFTRNPTHLALRDLKQIICICSLTLVGLVWEQLKLKIKQLEFLWSSCFFFFLQQCLTAPSVTLTVSPCAALFSHYLHALMVCNLSRRPICLLAHSTDTASLVSPHLAFLPQNVIDSPLAPPPPPHCLHRWISLGMKNQSRQSSALSINWVVQSASWIHTHIHI